MEGDPLSSASLSAKPAIAESIEAPSRAAVWMRRFELVVFVAVCIWLGLALLFLWVQFVVGFRPESAVGRLLFFGVGLGILAGLTILVSGMMKADLTLALATAPLIGALLGFLRYNFNPASIFLGDSGSLLVGFLLGCYGVLWSQKSATLLAMAFLEIASNRASAPVPTIPAAADVAATEERAACLRLLGVDRWHRMGFRGQG